MNHAQYPEYFARFYDLIYHQLRDTADKAYFFNTLTQCKGKSLEIGVGTGRLFTEALSAGSDIYGIDISESMLEILRKKLNDSDLHRVSLQNILDFSFGFRFDLVVAPFRVMMHLSDKDEQISALNNVYDSLNPGGTFIFDTFIPDLNQLLKGLENVTDFDGEYAPGKRLKRIVSTQPDLVNQLIHINFRFEWDDEPVNQSATWITQLRFFFRYELEHLIERSHFSKCKIFGDYKGNGLSAGSKEFVVVCTK